jgi:phosphohistidine phosphatase SixA
MKTTLRIAILAVVILVLSAAAHAQAARTIFLIRHADKISDAPDAVLSEAGDRRAACLAQMLADTGIDQIFTSDLQRTQQTAAPLAQQRHIKPLLFPLAKPEELIAAIKSSSAAHLLVVWHGNTLPGVIQALGGPEVPPIAEPEYDRFYILTLGANTVGAKKETALSFVALRYCNRRE